MGDRNDYSHYQYERGYGRRQDARAQQRQGPGHDEGRSWNERDAQGRGPQGRYGQAPQRADDYPVRPLPGAGSGGGYGMESRDQAGRGRGYRPTYADDDNHSAQRSHWRDDHPYARQAYQQTGAAFESDYSAIDNRDQSGLNPRQEPEHDHEPHYRAWREQQLAGHDRDYARWREMQVQRYDQDYRNWRDQRHEAFSREFASWREAAAPLGPEGGRTGLGGASTGASGAQTGHAGGGSSWSNSGGGATGAAGITGGSSGVAPQTHSVLDAYGASSPAASSASPASTAKSSGPISADTAQEPSAVQSVTDGHDHRKDDDADRRH